MRIKPLLTAVLGFAVAGGSVIGANQFLSQPTEASVEPAAVDPTLTQVVVAASEISFGKPLTPEVVSTQPWPKSAVPIGAFTSLDAVLPSLNGEPRRAQDRIAKGEIILTSKVSDFGEKVTVVDRLTPGARAVTIRVDAVTGVAGFITPGDRVDIALIHGGGRSLKAVTILQNIRVLAVDQVADETAEKPGLAATVTLEVTPDQSQTLMVARKAGELSLALRTPDSGDDTPLEITRFNDLVREQSPDEESPKAMVRVRRAGTLTQTELGE